MENSRLVDKRLVRSQNASAFNPQAYPRLNGSAHKANTIQQSKEPKILEYSQNSPFTQIYHFPLDEEEAEIEDIASKINSENVEMSQKKLPEKWVQKYFLSLQSSCDF